MILHYRYGRGPNKYTRNWEDENAYSKPGGGAGGPGTRRKKAPNTGRLNLLFLGV